MNAVKKHISSTEYGQRQEGHKNGLNATPVHTRKTGISVIRFSLQFGETELRSEKDTSNTLRAKTEKREKVARGMNPACKGRRSSFLINLNI